MGKNKLNKHNEGEKQAGKVGQHLSDKKLKRNGKPQKVNPGDHLKHIPFRLREIMKSKERVKMGYKSKKLQKAIASKKQLAESQDGDITVPHFKRRKRESEKAYVRRMENESKHVLFLTNNQVERRPELEAEKQERPADKGKSEKRKEYDKVRLQRLQKRKLDRREEALEKEMFIDEVPFGEVSMAPPSFSAKPRKSLLKPQKGPKDLLLNSLLGHTATSTAKPSMARQRIMEEERVRVVEAYRRLKKQKQQQHEDRTANLEKLTNPQ